MSTLVLGGAGMLGHKIVQTFVRQGLDVSYTLRGSKCSTALSLIPEFDSITAHEGVDAMDLDSLRKFLAQLRPNLIVNCIGVIKQRDQAKSARPSITINSMLPHLLVEWSSDWGGHLVHFSTDCVFSGRTGNYGVGDASDADDLYGKSKYLGETSAANAVTLRTSIIGRELSHFSSLVEWALSQEGRTISGYRNAIYTGMTTETMAKLVAKIAMQRPRLTGLHHAVSEKITKFDLLLLLRERFGVDMRIEPDEEFFCDRSMQNSGFERLTGFSIPSWPEQIDSMANDPTPYRGIHDRHAIQI